jgi:hypothetical protein
VNAAFCGTDHCDWEGCSVPLLPYDKFSIETPLPLQDAAARLAAAVEPRKFWRFGAGKRAFEGEVNAPEFRIRRLISYRNSFLPEIRGRIVPTKDGSRLDATLRLHGFVIAFLLVWFALAFLIGGSYVAHALATGAIGDAAVSIGIFAFAWILTSGAFTFEAHKARTILRELLGAEARPSSAKAPAAELAVAPVRRDV